MGKGQVWVTDVTMKLNKISLLYYWSFDPESQSVDY